MPIIFMYLHINHDGIVSPCTLDWPREVAIGDVNKAIKRDMEWTNIKRPSDQNVARQKR